MGLSDANAKARDVSAVARALPLGSLLPRISQHTSSLHHLDHTPEVTPHILGMVCIQRHLRHAQNSTEESDRSM
jgi:hypothetical protein